MSSGRWACTWGLLLVACQPTGPATPPPPVVALEPTPSVAPSTVPRVPRAQTRCAWQADEVGYDVELRWPGSEDVWGRLRRGGQGRFEVRPEQDGFAYTFAGREVQLEGELRALHLGAREPFLFRQVVTSRIGTPVIVERIEEGARATVSLDLGYRFFPRRVRRVVSCGDLSAAALVVPRVEQPPGERIALSGEVPFYRTPDAQAPQLQMTATGQEALAFETQAGRREVRWMTDACEVRGWVPLERISPPQPSPLVAQAIPAPMSPGQDSRTCEEPVPLHVVHPRRGHARVGTLLAGVTFEVSANASIEGLKSIRLAGDAVGLSGATAFAVPADVVSSCPIRQ